MSNCYFSNTHGDKILLCKISAILAILVDKYALPSFNKLATKERLLMDGKKPSSVESVWNKSDTVH